MNGHILILLTQWLFTEKIPNQFILIRTLNDSNIAVHISTVKMSFLPRGWFFAEEVTPVALPYEIRRTDVAPLYWIFAG